MVTTFDVPKSHLKTYTKVLHRFNANQRSKRYVTYVVEDSSDEGCPVYLVQKRPGRHSAIEVILLGHKDLIHYSGLKLNHNPVNNHGWSTNVVTTINVSTRNHHYPIFVMEVHMPGENILVLEQRRREDQTSNAISNNCIILSSTTTENTVLENLFKNISTKLTSSSRRSPRPDRAEEILESDDTVLVQENTGENECEEEVSSYGVSRLILDDEFTSNYATTSTTRRGRR
jgi:hypothetical protein